jgi:hypothetical protein
MAGANFWLCLRIFINLLLCCFWVCFRFAEMFWKLSIFLLSLCCNFDLKDLLMEFVSVWNVFEKVLFLLFERAFSV